MQIILFNIALFALFFGLTFYAIYSAIKSEVKMRNPIMDEKLSHNDLALKLLKQEKERRQGKEGGREGTQ